MLSRLLGFVAAFVVADFILVFVLFRLDVPITGLVFVGLATPALIAIPAVHFAPRYCAVCGKRTRRSVPLVQRWKEFFRIGGAAPHCSLHAS